tara:strand:- start:153 stop:332 length:180 start_codon:yes stop_codon:yes gene_type:complete
MCEEQDKFLVCTSPATESGIKGSIKTMRALLPKETVNQVFLAPPGAGRHHRLSVHVVSE